MQVFQFWCRDEEEAKKLDDSPAPAEPKRCGNCKLVKSRCLNGLFLLKVIDESIGMRVRASGTWCPDILGKSGIIVGGSMKKVKIQWMSESGKSETYLLEEEGVYRFKFDCNPSGAVTTAATAAAPWFFAHRLPHRRHEAESWQHGPQGEKHRIMFCASRDLNLTGLGLLVARTIDRVTLNVSQKCDHNDGHRVIYAQEFYEVQPPRSGAHFKLSLRQSVALSCDRIYLVVVTMYGGASVPGYGGEEFVTVDCGEEGEVLFKFDDYKHRTDRDNRATNVEEGIIDKIYFDL